MKVTLKPSEAMATHSYYHQGSKWEENQGGFFFFPNARGGGGAGGPQAEYFNNSFFYFMSFISNRMEFLKNLYREHLIL